MWYTVNSLPYENILDKSKFKALADDKINVTHNLKFGGFFWWVENILGKGENTVYQHFLLFPKCFQNSPSSRVIKTWDCVVKSLLVF